MRSVLSKVGTQAVRGLKFCAFTAVPHSGQADRKLSSRLPSALLAALLIAVCAPSPSSEAQVLPISAPSGNKEYRALTNGELRTLLPGSYIQEIVPKNLQDLSTPEQFNRDGTYIRYADNLELEGRYTVKDGKVCVKDDVHPEYCRLVFIDKKRNYYFGKSVTEACAVAISVNRVAVQTRGTRPLTEAELRTILPGSFIEQIVPEELEYMVAPEQFNEDGTYILYGDNSEFEGHYTIEGGKFCTIPDGKPKTCRYLLVDPKHRYWISKSMFPTDFRHVSIEPIRK